MRFIATGYISCDSCLNIMLIHYYIQVNVSVCISLYIRAHIVLNHYVSDLVRYTCTHIICTCYIFYAYPILTVYEYYAFLYMCVHA